MPSANMPTRSATLHLKRLLAASLLTSLCVASAFAKNTFKPNADGYMVIEAENMTLSSAKVVELEDASGGKGILMLNENAAASIELSLPRGTYVMDAYFSAPDPEHDGIFLVADGKIKRTPTPHHGGVLVYGAKFIVFDSDGSKPVTLELRSSWEGQPGKESGMSIDRIEILEFSRSAKRLELWTE